MFLHLEVPIELCFPSMKIIVFNMSDVTMNDVRRMNRDHWHSLTVTSTPKVSFASCTKPASVFVFFCTVCFTSFLGAFIASIARA